MKQACVLIEPLMQCRFFSSLATEFSVCATEPALCWLLLLTAPSGPTGHSIYEEGGSVSLAAAWAKPLWSASNRRSSSEHCPRHLDHLSPPPEQPSPDNCPEIPTRRPHLSCGPAAPVLPAEWRTEGRRKCKINTQIIKEASDRVFPVIFVYIDNMTNSLFVLPHWCFCWWRHWSQRSPSQRSLLAAGSSWIW